MLTSSHELLTLDDLREYVVETLSQHDQLERGAFQLSERILVRGDQPCGVYFCLHGPRAVRFSAIWETERNTILFYGSTGERFQKTVLRGAPKLELVAA